jgi:hypothetical protein
MNTKTKEKVHLVINELLETYSNSFQKQEEKIKAVFNRTIDKIVGKLRALEEKVLSHFKLIKTEEISLNLTNHEKNLDSQIDKEDNFRTKFTNMFENLTKIYDSFDIVNKYVDNIENQLNLYSYDYKINLDFLNETFTLKNPLNDSTLQIDQSGLKVKNYNTSGHRCVISNRSFKYNLEINVKVSKMLNNNWMMFGIINQITNLNNHSYGFKTCYGWAKCSKQVYKDGVCDDYDPNYDGDIKEGDDLIMRLKPTEGILQLKNKRSSKEYTLNIPKGLEWYLHFNLH